MYNKITLVGNLTRDIEIRYGQSGTAIGNTAIACSHKYKGADGQQKEEVMFVDLTFFGRTAEVANQYLRKGSQILVDGRLKLDQWTAQDGTKRSKHSVTVSEMKMLGNKEQSQAPQNNNGQNGGQGYYGGGQPNTNANNGQPQSNGQPNTNNGKPQSNGKPNTNNGQPQPDIPVIQIDGTGDEIPF